MADRQPPHDRATEERAAPFAPRDRAANGRAARSAPLAPADPSTSADPPSAKPRSRRAKESSPWLGIVALLVLATTSAAAGFAIWRTARAPQPQAPPKSPCAVTEAVSSYHTAAMEAVWKFSQCGEGALCSAFIQDNPPHATIWTGKPQPDGVCTLPDNEVKAGPGDFTVVLAVKPVDSDLVEFRMLCPAAGGDCKAVG
jgi:hypothetical protein